MRGICQDVEWCGPSVATVLFTSAERENGDSHHSTSARKSDSSGGGSCKIGAPRGDNERRRPGELIDMRLGVAGVFRW